MKERSFAKQAKPSYLSPTSRYILSDFAQLKRRGEKKFFWSAFWSVTHASLLGRDSASHLVYLYKNYLRSPYKISISPTPLAKKKKMIIIDPQVQYIIFRRIKIPSETCNTKRIKPCRNLEESQKRPITANALPTQELSARSVVWLKPDLLFKIQGWLPIYLTEGEIRLLLFYIARLSERSNCCWQHSATN